MTTFEGTLMHEPLAREKFLELFLLGLDSPTEVRLTILTEPELKKVSDDGLRAPERLRKRSRLRVMLCQSYAAAVNAQRLAEGKPADFTPAQRKGPERIGASPLQRGKDGLLLECLVSEVESVAYEINGKPVPFPDIHVLPWLKPSSSPAAHQGLDKPVIYRTIKLANVVDLEFLRPHGPKLGFVELPVRNPADALAPASI